MPHVAIEPITRRMRRSLLLSLLWLGPSVAVAQEPPGPAQEADQASADSAQREADEVVRQEVDSGAVARAILVALDSVYGRLSASMDSLRVADAEQGALLRVRGLALVDSLDALKSRMDGELRALRAGYAGADSILAAFEDFLGLEWGRVRERVVSREEQLDSLRSLRSVTPLQGLDELEEQIWISNAQLDTTLIFIVGSLEEAEALGIDTGPQWGLIDRYLLSRA
jgi:hypothetical protein